MESRSNKTKSQTFIFVIKALTRSLNPIQDGLFRGCSRMATEEEGGPLSLNLSHISYIDETWHLQKIQKIHKSPSVPLTSSFFSRKSEIFVVSGNTGIDCILMHNL